MTLVSGRMTMPRTFLMLCAAGALSSRAALSINYVGSALLADYRTTSAPKLLDGDTNNVFGTAGYVIYGTDVVGNSNAGSVPSTNPLTYSSGTRSTKLLLPAWLTLINNGQGYIATSYDSYPYADDPTVAPGPAVPDVQIGFALRSPVTQGTDASLVDIRFGVGFPLSGLRIGVICHATGNDVVDYIALTNNIDAGASTVRTGPANPTVYFFDVFGANVNDTITLRLRKNAGGNANVAYNGLTFDAFPAGPAPPFVNIYKPVRNTTYTAPASAIIRAGATDADGTVKSVAFYANGEKLGEAATAPYAWAWNDVPAGLYALLAVATDATGLRATSAIVHVSVTDPTPFRITSFEFTNAQSTLVWESQPTAYYRVEAARTLSPADWTPIGTSIQASNLLSEFSPVGSGETQKFYRVMRDTTSVPPTIVSYPLPSCYRTSTQLTLTADSTSVPVIDCSTEFRNYDYCTFSCSGTNLITIVASEDITSYSISPLASGITGTTNGRTLTFTLPSPQYLIVKINNLRELVIAADALETNVPPGSGPGIYNVAEGPYAADSSGTTLTTASIQRAISDASAAGGGTIYVPAGVYKCGNLVLQQNTSLYLEGGAVIRGSGNALDYSTRFHKNSLGMDGTWFICTATNASNITVYGRGTIDGDGHAMRNSQSYLNDLLVPLQCSYFTIDGITLRDSGGWAFMVTRSDNVRIQNTKHFNNNDLDYENDAIDIQESQNVVVKHTVAVSEDDTYSVKTWNSTTDIAANWPGVSEVATNIIFDDCVAWSRTGAFKIGQGIFQPQANIAFQNSSVYRCMYAAAVIYKNGIVGATGISFTKIDVEGFWPRTGNLGRWLNADITSGGSITNLLVANINTRAPDEMGSVLRGFSPTSQFYGVQLNNNFYTGAHGTNFSSLHITSTNAFVNDLTFQ